MQKIAEYDAMVVRYKTTKKELEKLQDQNYTIVSENSDNIVIDMVVQMTKRKLATGEYAK